MNDGLRVLFGTFAEAESMDFSEPLDDTKCAANYGYYSDSDLEDEDFANPKAPEPARGHPFDPFCFTSADNEPTPTCGEHKERLEKGKVIKIQDMALITQVFSNPLYGPSDDVVDSRRFYSTSTPVQSSLRPTDRRRIASQGGLRSLQCWRTQFLDHPQNQSTDSQIRFLPLLLSGRKLE